MTPEQCDAVASEFLHALSAGVGEEERLIVCGFEGDPDSAPLNAWRPHPWRRGAASPFSHNVNGYVTVSAFGRAADNTWRRRNECFRAGQALMVDDVGTKVDPSVVAAMPPSAIVETSPGNFQWWYFLAEPERDKSRFDAVIRAFIAGRLLGSDPGMNGVTRVGRMPGYINGKAKYGGNFRTQLSALDGRRYAIDALIEGFGLKLNGQRFMDTKKLVLEEFRERNRAFAVAYKWLAERRMIKSTEPDMSGWSQMRCPWVDDHTNAADTGAAIREPSDENGYYGAFRCHHGHCIDKGWGELTEWIVERSIEELEVASIEGNKLKEKNRGQIVQ